MVRRLKFEWLYHEYCIHRISNDSCSPSTYIAAGGVMIVPDV